MMPVKCWHMKPKQEINVLKQFVSRKQSIQCDFADKRSSLILSCIIARTEAASFAELYSDERTSLAFATLSLRTRYHGDSGAKGKPAIRMTMKMSWQAKGAR